MNLFQAIFERDSRTSPAIIFEKRQISYAELRQLTLTIAKTLAFLKVAKTARVAILLHDSPEFIEAFIAICSMGAIAVPINMALRLEEQRTILYDCGASLAIVESDLCNTLLTGASERLRYLKAIIAVVRENTRETQEQSTDTQGALRWSTQRPVVHELQVLTE